MAVLGFEFGFSLAKPQALVIWEAQFGDFANGAQVIIDQFISSSESKWNRQSDLVLFLPHGYEGQGPEHSSARLERYLQLCAENNLQVGNVTQPAQLFHLLRRQCHRDVKKPLILMTPKSALRHPENTSALEAFTEGAFQSAFISVRPPQDAPTRVIFCSGKIAFEVEAEIKRQKRQDLAVIRLEMIYPFPADTLAHLLQDLKCTGDLVWLQEEPKNMGAWRFVVDRFEEELGRSLAYFGRKVSASPSVGSYKLHQEEQRSLLAAVTDLTISKGVQR
jgi:2-oxoglutarate dehydrogenase E1 component